jgi:multiple sugar transport system permease protein
VVVCLAAYALARMRFWGRNVVYIIILASFLLPHEVMLVPLYLGFSELRLLNSYFSLIAVGIADAFNLFLLTQFFTTFPTELEDAASIDGSSRLGVLWRILVPLAKPALITIVLFRFFATWNDFTWPLIAINSDAYRTLPVGIVTFVARSMGMHYGVIMASAILACLPALIVFAFLQRYFVQGITTTGLK